LSTISISRSLPSVERIRHVTAPGPASCVSTVIVYSSPTWRLGLVPLPYKRKEMNKICLSKSNNTRNMAFRWISGGFHFHVEWWIINWNTSIIHIDIISADIIWFIGNSICSIFIIDYFRGNQKTFRILKNEIVFFDK
jgi:hypothetical protein